MDSLFRVEGIYDKRTIQRLKDLKLKDLSFDFRPRSFNFIQQHNLIELLDELSLDDNCYLHFENEADFVVKNILDSVCNKRKKETVYLEFSDDREVEYYESFDQQFIWHFSNEAKNTSSIIKSKNLKGIVLPFSELLKAHESGVLHNFSNNFHAQFFELLTNNAGKLILQMDWDSNLFSSIIEYFDFDIISVAINNKVEVCYRNVDLGKVQSHVSFLKELSL
jgi:hypothetical protein